MLLTNELIRFFAEGSFALIGLFAAVQAIRSYSFPAPRQSVKTLPDLQTPAFLFDQDTLVDASPSGAALIANSQAGQSDRDAVIAVLSRQFPNLREKILSLGTDCSVALAGTGDAGLGLTLSDRQGLLRISLNAPGVETATRHYEDLERESLLDELNMLRLITRDTPQLIWTEDAQGHLIWANAAYLSYADRQMPDDDRSGRVWPGERLFADIPPPLPNDPRTFGGRHALQLPGERAEHWFDITAVPQDGSVIYFAIDANAAVRAERAQQEFQQTLAKTFAQLSTGLAIFNRKRQLAMFNPALLDMTGLAFGFMSTRPTIDMVLHRLRETRKLPEPKNYNTWKEQFSALEAAAKKGTYSELWEMPDGQTYRVTGRPHPDGALAFLFEDITAEVSLTRHFRAEIETGQSVMNALPDAIAVFSPSNTLVMTNAAYDEIWQRDDESQMLVHDLRSALRIWKARCGPSSLWQDVENFGQMRRDSHIVSDGLIMTNGRRLDCAVQAITGGMTLVRFTPAMARLESSPQPPRQAYG